MLTYEEALAIAKKKKSKINYCTEYNNAYAFSFDDDTDGGDMPIVVMKNGGKVMGIVEYAILAGNDFVRSFAVK